MYSPTHQLVGMPLAQAVSSAPQHCALISSVTWC
eukprot:COSAG05_NODE_15269_length_373_cov_1142.959854_1_plen_33_part_01